MTAAPWSLLVSMSLSIMARPTPWRRAGLAHRDPGYLRVVEDIGDAAHAIDLAADRGQYMVTELVVRIVVDRIRQVLLLDEYLLTYSVDRRPSISPRSQPGANLALRCRDSRLLGIRKCHVRASSHRDDGRLLVGGRLP